MSTDQDTYAMIAALVAGDLWLSAYACALFLGMLTPAGKPPSSPRKPERYPCVIPRPVDPFHPSAMTTLCLFRTEIAKLTLAQSNMSKRLPSGSMKPAVMGKLSWQDGHFIGIS